MVVEDEQAIALDIRETLGELGYGVSKTVSTGRQAIAAAGRLRPQLVLMDITLRGAMDGIAAAGEIRDRFAIPVVYLTAHLDEATLTRAAATDPFGYVAKPFKDRDLGIAISLGLKRDGLRRQEAAGEVTRARAGFSATGIATAIMVHELNNPLSCTISNVAYCADEVDRLQRSLESPDETESHATTLVRRELYLIAEALADAHEAADRVRRVVAVFGGRAAVLSHQPRTTDLSLVLTSSMRMTAHAMKPEVCVHKDYQTTPRVDGDEGLLTQVFSNLLINASDAFVEDGGTHEIRISCHTDAKGRAVVEIRDTGPGILPEVLPRIFDPFFTTKRSMGGTGLGLPVCRSILRRCGGEISVEATGRTGTTLRVVLPAASAGPAAAATLPSLRAE